MGRCEGVGCFRYYMYTHFAELVKCPLLILAWKHRALKIATVIITIITRHTPICTGVPLVRLVPNQLAFSNNYVKETLHTKNLTVHELVRQKPFLRLEGLAPSGVLQVVAAAVDGSVA